MSWTSGEVYASTYIRARIVVEESRGTDYSDLTAIVQYKRTNTYGGVTSGYPSMSININGNNATVFENTYKEIPAYNNDWHEFGRRTVRVSHTDAVTVNCSFSVWQNYGWGAEYFTNGGAGISGSVDCTLAAFYTNPSTPTVSISSKTYNSATFAVSISSYGNPSSASGRYIQAAILAQNSYGDSYRYANSTNTTSATITVNNSSSTGTTALTIQGNKKYWYGGYASNTKKTSQTVTGTFYTPCPPLSALSLSSQVYATYNTVTATLSYTRQSDGGAETRTGKYRYSTDNGSTWTNWTSFGTVSNTTGTFTATLPTSKTVLLQARLDTTNGGASETKQVSITTKTTHTAPNFSNFTYEDASTTAVSVSGNNQIFIQGQSQPKVTISTANKATANDGATITGYTASLNAESIQIAYSSSASVSGTFSTKRPTASGTLALAVAANDSLSLAKSVSKNVTVIPWSAPTITASATRTNNFESETTLSISGTYATVTVDGTVKNTLAVAYRYKKTSESSWGSWTNRPITKSGSNYSATDLVLSFDNEYAWDIQVRAVDAFTTTTVSLSLSIGKAIFRIGTNGFVYNNEQPLMPSHVGQVIMSTTLTTASAVAAIYSGSWTSYSGISVSGLYCWRRTA
ncbi:hypothetical protein IKE71_01325 [Candidatus Saccharibacteria bacterium]|nr:hypothetical protein [Candidatus Saccharibacteria bacterium]